MAITFDTSIKIPDDVLVSQTDGEAVLLKLTSECYFGLDATGARFWELLITAPTVQGAFEAALGEFDVQPDRLRADFAEFLDALATRGLIEPATA